MCSFVFKGVRLVVPTCARKELMSVAYSTNIRTEGRLRRVREHLSDHELHQMSETASQSVMCVWPIARLSLRNHSFNMKQFGDPGPN